MKKIILIVLAMFLVGSVFANIDISGKIYSQYRWTNSSGNAYWNSPNFGSFSSGASVWPGYGRLDKKFANFLRTESEFTVNANVSKYVKAYVRVKTIFNSDETNGDGEQSASAWADDWDNARGFFKLRGFLIKLNPNNNFIKSIDLGTPMGLPFNKWLVSDRRYIDRDNLKGIVVRGHQISDKFSWNFARMWNAGYMGPGWNSLNTFRSEDGTYAASFKLNVNDDAWISNLNFMYYSDTNLDPKDEDLTGTDDGNIKAKDDYDEFGITYESNYNLTDEIGIDLLGIFTNQKFADRLDANDDNIADNLAWVTPLTPAHWWGINEPYADINTFSGILSLNTTDPFDVGITPKAQLFYIDNNLYTPFGSRREDDMLMIHGGLNALAFTDGNDVAEGGRQHQSLNTFLYGGGQSAVNEAMTDNNFLRLGEDFYETAIGYAGGTLESDFDLGNFSINAQGNYILRTDNNDGKINEKNDNYDGNDTTNAWYYKVPHDFKAIVGDVSAKTAINGYNLKANVKFGNWQDVKADYYGDSLTPVGTHAVECTAMVFEITAQKQLTKSISYEFRPRYQTVLFNESGIDFSGNAFDNDYSNNDVMFNQKIVYNFGGFDFWLRSENVIRKFKSEGADDLKLNWGTVHAAFEVKF